MEESKKKEAQEKKEKRRKRIKRIIIIIIIIIIILLLLRKCCHKKPEVLINEPVQLSETTKTINNNTKKDETNQENIKEEEDKSVSKGSEKYYWVIFYDQYGNELQRSVSKYLSIPEFIGTYPEGFIGWDKALDPITGETYFYAICETHSNPPKPIVHGIFTYVDSTTRKVVEQVIPFGVTVHLDLDGGSIEFESTIDVVKFLRIDLREPGYTPDKSKFIGYEYIEETHTFKAHYGDYIVTFDSLKIGEEPDVIYVEEGNPLIEEPSMHDTDEYYFKGWYKDYLFKNGLWNFETDEVHSDITLYAKWTIKDLYNKVLSVQKLLTVGENKLVNDITKSNTDVIRIAGVDCYVLQYNSANNTAQFISKEIYYQIFGTYRRYDSSHLKTWMDNFYNSYFKTYDTDPSIIEPPDFGYKFINTSVKYYYRSKAAKSSNPFPMSTFASGYLNQKVFALDANVGNSYRAKFKWTLGKFYDNPSRNAYGFWVTAGLYNDSGKKGERGMHNYYTGAIFVHSPNNADYGARPCFWIQLEIPEPEEEQEELVEEIQTEQEVEQSQLEESFTEGTYDPVDLEEQELDDQIELDIQEQIKQEEQKQQDQEIEKLAEQEIECGQLEI